MENGHRRVQRDNVEREDSHSKDAEDIPWPQLTEWVLNQAGPQSPASQRVDVEHIKSLSLVLTPWTQGGPSRGGRRSLELGSDSFSGSLCCAAAIWEGSAPRAAPGAAAVFKNNKAFKGFRKEDKLAEHEHGLRGLKYLEWRSLPTPRRVAMVGESRLVRRRGRQVSREAVGVWAGRRVNADVKRGIGGHIRASQRDGADSIDTAVVAGTPSLSSCGRDGGFAGLHAGRMCKRDAFVGTEVKENRRQLENSHRDRIQWDQGENDLLKGIFF